MQILNSILEQIHAVGLPLYAVTLTAVPRAHTPLLLMLHWHGFRPQTGVGAPVNQPVPGSALQLNEPWQSLEQVELAMLDAAWQLGAWDMERRVRRACNWVGASAREALECRQAFGDNPHAPGDEQHLVAEAPDRLELMHLGAQQGYVRWLFRPVRGGLWQDCTEDATLAADGSRQPPCPLRPQPPRFGRSVQTVYRLGRSTRLIVA